MIDSHTHLHLCEQPTAELVAEAEAAGVTRMLTVGIDGASCRAALAAAEDFPQVYAAIGRHPNAAGGFDDADLAELRALAAHERCVAIGETGLDFYRDGDRPPGARTTRAFAAQIELARETGKPLVIHTRAPRSGHARPARGGGGRVSVVMHCFSMPGRLEECVERGYAISFAGNVTYKSAADLADAARRVPEEALLVETDAPYLTPQAVRKERNRPRSSCTRRRFVAELRGVSVEELGRDGDAQRGAHIRLGMSAVADGPVKPSGQPDGPVQPSLRRMRRFGVRPGPRARPELPDRLQHPRRDRPRGRAGAARTWCLRSAAA